MILPDTKENIRRAREGGTSLVVAIGDEKITTALCIANLCSYGLTPYERRVEEYRFLSWAQEWLYGWREK